MTKNKLTFDTAYAELQDIAEDIQSEDVGIDSLDIKIKRAAELIDFCKKQLRTIEGDIKNILTDNTSDQPS